MTSAGPARLHLVAAADDHPDLVAADAAAQHYTDAAASAATDRTYNSVLRGFSAWCEEMGLSALPADPDTVKRYLSLAAERDDIAASTVAVRCAAIARAHLDAGLPDPTTDPAVRTVMEGVRNERTKQASTRQAPPATLSVLQPMVAAAHAKARTIRQQIAARRDIAVLAVTYAASLRRSEAAALSLEDLSLVDSPEHDRLLRVRIRGSKTSRAKIQHVYIPRGRSDDALCCPWCALQHWIAVVAARDQAAARERRRQRRHDINDPDAVIDAVAIAIGRLLRADTTDPHTHRCAGDWPSATDPTAPLFRPVDHGGWPHETALTDKSVARIIEKRSLAAGVARMRGHSPRAGAITEAFDRGASLEDVMALARHKNPATTLRYDRRREQRSARVDLGL